MKLFRRLRRKAKKARGPPSHGENAATKDVDPLREEPIIHENSVSYEEPELANAAYNSYDDRIEEMGELMSEQGRCLDEVTEQARRLSTENSMLRERLSTSMVVSKPPPTRKRDEKSFTNDAVHKIKEENSLLSQQADLLSNELLESNRLLAERDTNLATLRNEFSSCLEKARSLMLEKKAWKVNEIQQLKEVEALKDSVERSSTLKLEIAQYQAERHELNAEIGDMGMQMSYMTKTMEKQAHELVSMRGELDKATSELRNSEQAINLTKQESIVNRDVSLAQQEQLRHAKARNDQLNQILNEVREKLAESQISQHKLQVLNDSLRADTKDLVERHKSQATNWHKSQNKVIESMRDQYEEEKQMHLKQIDNLRRANSSLESDSMHCKRDLLSCQQRCSSIEKSLASTVSEHNNAVSKLLLKTTAAETEVESSHLMTSELRSKVSSMEERITSFQINAKDKGREHEKVVSTLETQLASTRELNDKQSSRIALLEEEKAKLLKVHTKEQQEMQQTVEHRVREANIELESLRVSMKNEILKAQSKDELLAKQSVLHESTLTQMAKERTECIAKMEKELSDEREVQRCLMSKVQEVLGTIQTLTSEKYQIVQQNNKHLIEIEELEKIIENGEIRLAQFKKQLSLSLQDQECRVLKESELKKELQMLKRTNTTSNLNSS